MKRITIDKKEYTFEFTIEASLYDDCTRSVMDMFVKGGMVQGAAEDNDVNSAMENLLDTIANLPQKALTLFYAGLLEHHGPEGDGSIQGKNDAKKLLASYLKENNLIMNDGFIRFRLPEYRKEICLKLCEAIEDYYIEKEYQGTTYTIGVNLWTGELDWSRVDGVIGAILQGMYTNSADLGYSSLGLNGVAHAENGVGPGAEGNGKNNPSGDRRH